MGCAASSYSSAISPDASREKHTVVRNNKTVPGPDDATSTRSSVRSLPTHHHEGIHRIVEPPPPPPEIQKQTEEFHKIIETLDLEADEFRQVTFFLACRSVLDQRHRELRLKLSSQEENVQLHAHYKFELMFCYFELGLRQLKKWERAFRQQFILVPTAETSEEEAANAIKIDSQEILSDVRKKGPPLLPRGRAHHFVPLRRIFLENTHGHFWIDVTVTVEVSSSLRLIHNHSSSESVYIYPTSFLPEEQFTTRKLEVVLGPGAKYHMLETRLDTWETEASNIVLKCRRVRSRAMVELGETQISAEKPL